MLALSRSQKLPQPGEDVQVTAGGHRGVPGTHWHSTRVSNDGSLSTDPAAAGAEGPGVPGADGGGPAAGHGAPGDAAAGEGGGEERQRHPAAPEAAEGGRAHPGEWPRSVSRLSPSVSPRPRSTVGLMLLRRNYNVFLCVNKFLLTRETSGH